MLALAATGAPVRAEEGGEWTHKAGEWQLSELKPDGTATPTQKICWAKGTIEDFVKNLKPCQDRKTARTGDVTTVDALCPRGQQQLAVHVTLTAATEEAYRLEFSSTLTQPGAAPTTTQSTGEGKWLGPCAEGEKPIN
jgi:hypothetical protein